MPERRRVPTLTNLSLASVSDLICSEAQRVAKIVVTKFIFDEVEAAENFEESSKLGESWERENYLKDQIQSFKDFLFCHIPNNLDLVERLLEESVLKGLQKAVRIKNHEWTPTTNNAKYVREMYAIIAFSEIMILPQRRVLDLNAIPKMIRSTLYCRLKGFTGLRTLILGCGSGGWVAHAFSGTLLMGLPSLKHLVHFSFKYDCTDIILQCLAETCAGTLRVLDMEHSRLVNDECIPYVLAFKKLQVINMHQNDFTLEGMAQIILTLPELCHLDRGDYLCDVIDYCVEHNLLQNRAPLNLQEFNASEEYYFHTEEQMKRIAKYCPKMRRLLFMFERSSCPTQGLSVLCDFQHLKELELWGGRFYADGLLELLQFIGNQLTSLALVHVEDVDERAFAVLTATCQNLVRLTLSNCEFVGSVRHIEDVDLNENIEAEEVNEVDYRAQLEAREIRNILTPLLDLESLKIVSDCDGKYLTLIIGNCINIKELNLGMNTSISDEVIMKIFSINSLSRLERLYIQKSTKVTMDGINMIMANCDKLKSFKDLQWFSSISEEEFARFGERIKRENLDLVIEDEKTAFQEWNETQQIRKEKIIELVGGGKKFPAFDNSIEWNTD